MPPSDPTTATAAPISPASTNPAPATPGSATIPPPAAPAPVAPPVATAQPAAPAAAAAPAAGAPPAEEKKPEVFILVLDTGSPLDPALVAKAVALAKEAGITITHYAFVAHDTMAAYGRLMGLSADGKTAYVAPVNALKERREFPLAELFDPKTAETAYLNLVAAAKKAAEAAAPAEAAKPPGGAPPAATVLAMILAMLLPVIFGAGCTPDQETAAKSGAARIGTVVATIETPAAVQLQAQLVTAEVLQRAVSTKKQATVAAWCTCISRALEDLAGTANPSAADLETAIKLEAGPQTDPEFDTLIATATDLWGVTKAAIPAGSTPAQVEAYLAGAATGVQTAAAGYLPSTTATVAWITLGRAHERALHRVHRAEVLASHRRARVQ